MSGLKTLGAGVLLIGGEGRPPWGFLPDLSVHNVDWASCFLVRRDNRFPGFSYVRLSSGRFWGCKALGTALSWVNTDPLGLELTNFYDHI